MPCDITGVRDYAHLEDAGGLQWPVPEGSPPVETERRLFADGQFYHPDGRAKFLFEDPRPLSEPASDKHPFVLLTGRGSASQWHTQTRTGKSAVLQKLAPQQIFVEVNPADARALGITANQEVLIESQRGSLRAIAVLTHAVSAGQVFIPMHYEETNRLTDAVFDPYSRQPSYKACAVRVRRV
jgi:assimilatory nitrate reductase catalytic subunit